MGLGKGHLSWHQPCPAKWQLQAVVSYKCFVEHRQQVCGHSGPRDHVKAQTLDKGFALVYV